jgi:bd-type cytochrome oxidase subunit I
MTLDLAHWTAIAVLIVFLLVATLGLRIFGWRRLSRRVRLLIISLVVLGTMPPTALIMAPKSLMRQPTGHSTDGPSANEAQALTAGYPALADRSIRLLESSYYNGTGLWHMCLPVGTCSTKNRDWGADALTNVLYFRWALARDRSVLPYLRRLAQTARLWQPGDNASSDNATWDAVADVRLYQATGSKTALAKAKGNTGWVRAPARPWTTSGHLLSAAT